MATVFQPKLGVCSWSLRVSSVAELRMLLDRLGCNRVQLACGDPHHASWVEGEDLPVRAKAAGFEMTGAMLGFPGEDYTTPQTIAQTGGFGDPATRGERLRLLEWALGRTLQLGLRDLSFHGGFLPPADSAEYQPFRDTLRAAADLADSHGVTLALETGQETSTALARFLTDVNRPNLGVNFDPANMLLYDQDDPLEAVQLLAPWLRSVHAKDARRPKVKGTWGEEVPLGEGEVNIPRFIDTLRKLSYSGPLMVEREVGSQEERVRDIAAALRLLEQLIR